MTRLALGLILAAATARADSSLPPGAPRPPRAEVRLRGVGAHEAAHFLGMTYRRNLLVVGPDPPLTLDLVRAGSRPEEAIAAAAGLEVWPVNSMIVLTPPLARPRRLVGRLPRSVNRVDLSFVGADVRNLVRLMSDVMRLEGATPPRGGPMTLTTHEVSSGDVVRAMVSVLDRDVAMVGGRTRKDATGRVDWNNAGVPDSEITRREWPCPAREREQPFLRCIEVERLAVRAVAGPPRGRRALLAPRDRPAAVADRVAGGDRVGTTGARVLEIGDDFVLLEGDLRLELAK